MRRPYDWFAGRSVLPIALREDLVVRIIDLPRDMTRAEAEKIGRVVKAMAGETIGE